MSQLSFRRYILRLVNIMLGMVVLLHLRQVNLSELFPKAVAQSPPSRRQAELDVNAIDRFITQEMSAHNLPGLALAITQGDEVVYSQGYGTAGADQPVTPQTQFFVASLSKSFTALAIMQLVEAGEIDLDAPVQNYLPEFTLTDSSVASQITIRHLLNQTSGLADAGYPEGRLPYPTTLPELVSRVSRARAVATPGTEYHYFNPNYQLLARVVEVVSGEPFSAYLQTHIFTPLQMTHTFSAITSDEAKQRAGNLAQGHLLAYGITVPVEEMSGFLGGSGGMISTAEEMANYLIMQNNGGRFGETALLSPSGIERMHTAPQDLDSNYAMGWIENKQDRTRILEHDGILSVFYANMVLLPETQHGIVLLYNSNSLAASALATPRIKNGLVALLTGSQPTPDGMSVRLWGVLMALATLLSAILATRSLLRLPRWRQRAQVTPLWRLLAGIVGTFTPALILLGLPSLITATSDRAFSYAQLFRSMPEVLIWLAIGTVLGIINGTIRSLHLIRGAVNRGSGE